MQFKDACTKQCAFGTIGLILASGGLIFAVFWADIFHHILDSEMVIRPNSKVYDGWKSPPFDLFLDIYLLNWTNPEELKIPGKRPKLKELGPYRFKEKRNKIDIRWHPENSTVSYRQKNMYHFDEENSKGKLSDIVTTLNVVSVSAGASAQNWSYVRQKSVSVGLAMYQQELYVTKTANELLFEGYSDDMVDVAKEFPIFGEDVKVPFDKVGWFYGRNNTADLNGHYNIYTGADNIFKIGQMHEWNYTNRTSAFPSYCGMINGSAGEFYPPRVDMNTTISLYTADMCRTINFYYVGKEVIEGIEGYKFSGTPRSVDNGTKYPENKCFCTSAKCAPSGTFEISSCRYGSPVFMSFPHFFNADPYYLQQVEGLEPTEDKHEFYMILEPLTGVPLQVSARFQANMLVKEYPNIVLFKDTPTIYFPIIWFEQKVTINKELASDLKLALSIPTTGHICSGVIFSIGLVMLFWFPIDRLVRRKSKSDDPKLSVNKKDIEATTVQQQKGPEDSPLLKKKFAVPKVEFVKSIPNVTLTIKDNTN